MDKEVYNYLRKKDWKQTKHRTDLWWKQGEDEDGPYTIFIDIKKKVTYAIQKNKWIDSPEEAKTDLSRIKAMNDDKQMRF